jgi:putative membrane protein insertion efficiency factor
MLRRAAVGLIRLYQKYLSPLKLPTCRFYPSCSEYCVQALEQRGFLAGALLGIWRIARCNPFCRAGYDPVPGRDDDSGTAVNQARADR